MTTPLFDAIFTLLIGEEGGYTDDPDDPGGETNWGISRAAYPDVDIKNLTRAGAEAIYIRDYWSLQTASGAWQAVSGDDLPPVLALMTFDAAVNNGIVRAREWLQAAVGVPTDGLLGPQTMGALHAALADPTMGADGVAAEFLARRIDFMASLSTWQYFGLGWSRRLAGLPFKAKSLPVAPAPQPAHP
jgi:lysozyme family protein